MRAVLCNCFVFGLAIVANATTPDPITRERVLAILDHEHFQPITRVAEIPHGILAGARVIPARRSIDSLFANRGEDFQRHPASVDPSRPYMQLEFGGLSDHYFLLCYLGGGLTEAEHVLLIQRQKPRPKLILHTTAYPEARDLRRLRQVLARGPWEPFEISKPSIMLFE